MMSWLNLAHHAWFGYSVSSVGTLVTIAGGRNVAVLADNGYIPQKLCCTDSRALGIKVARRYTMSAFSMILGMYPS